MKRSMVESLKFGSSFFISSNLDTVVTFDKWHLAIEICWRKIWDTSWTNEWQHHWQEYQSIVKPERHHQEKDFKEGGEYMWLRCAES